MKPKPKPKRKTNTELLRRVRAKLGKVDLVAYKHLEDRLALLHDFELAILTKRILAPKPASRTKLALDSRLGGPQASQLERKMLVRVLGILHNTPKTGGPS